MKQSQGRVEERLHAAKAGRKVTAGSWPRLIYSDGEPIGGLRSYTRASKPALCRQPSKIPTQPLDTTRRPKPYVIYSHQNNLIECELAAIVRVGRTKHAFVTENTHFYNLLPNLQLRF